MIGYRLNETHQLCVFVKLKPSLVDHEVLGNERFI
jgi:hypothetical protein